MQYIPQVPRRYEIHYKNKLVSLRIGIVHYETPYLKASSASNSRRRRSLDNRITKHQILSMGDKIVEKNQERQKQRVQTAAQLRADTESTEQQKAELKTQLERFESERRSAFNDAYITPEGCAVPQTEKLFTECINHKMRAKRTFFNSYGPPPSGFADTAEGIRYGESN